jgi:hypothetical protein
MEDLVIRKRTITADDLKFIQSVVHENWEKSRTQISKILCTKWDWRQPNGQLKDMACREVLLTLYRKGLIDYPAPRQPSTNGNPRKPFKLTIDQAPLCILPWIFVKCLASKIMALNIKRISSDWHQMYQYPLYMLETFVEQDRFKGTCYKASNWIRIGETKGTSKKGHKHLKHGKLKDVYLYPLEKNYKRLLNGTA